MEQVKNLDDKRVCDKSKDSKVIIIRKKTASVILVSIVILTPFCHPLALIAGVM